MTDEYTGRRVEIVKISNIDGDAITYGGSWSFLVPDGLISEIEVDKEYLFETGNGSRVCGMAEIYKAHGVKEPVVSRWIWHKTDEDMEIERKGYMDAFKRQLEEDWKTNKEDWTAREAKLGDPLRKRLEMFRKNSNGKFDRNGWPYELVVSELAEMYYHSGGEDTDEIEEYARDNGTSGNQHDFAKALAAAMHNDKELASTAISALTPITGDPYFKNMG